MHPGTGTWKSPQYRRSCYDRYMDILRLINHSSFLPDGRYTDIPDIGGYMCGMVIPAIWDVIWGPTNLLLTFNRPPNTLSPKDRLSKKIIFTDFEVFTEAHIIACKVFSKESHPQVKNLENFFRKFDLREFSSDFNDYYMQKHLF